MLHLCPLHLFLFLYVGYGKKKSLMQVALYLKMLLQSYKIVCRYRLHGLRSNP